MIKFVLPMLCLVVCAEAGICDVVELTNGDRVTGTLEYLAGDKLALDTAYAGEISIDWKQVHSLATTGEYQVDLVGGQTITGAIVPVQPGEYRIGTNRGPTTLATEITAIRTTPETDNGFFSDWHAAADLGYTTTRGNGHITQFSFQFQPQRRRTRDSIRADLQSLRSFANDRGGGTNMHSLEFRYDRFVSPRLFFFLVGKGEHDPRESLQLRTREGGGLGVRLRIGTRTQVSTLSGSAFVQERFKGQNYRLAGGGLLGYELETAVLDPLQITSKGQILQSLADFSRFRSEWDSSVRVPFTRTLNFGVRLFHRFDSSAPADARKADYGLISTIGMTF